MLCILHHTWWWYSALKHGSPHALPQVDLSGFPALNNQRFGARWVGRVANPGDILQFTRRAVRRVGGTWAAAPHAVCRRGDRRVVNGGFVASPGAAAHDNDEEARMDALVQRQDDIGQAAVRGIVLAQLQSGQSEPLRLFLEDELTEAVVVCVKQAGSGRTPTLH